MASELLLELDVTGTSELELEDSAVELEVEVSETLLLVKVAEEVVTLEDGGVAPHEYTLSLSGPPQVSEASPAQGMLQSASALMTLPVFNSLPQ